MKNLNVNEMVRVKGLSCQGVEKEESNIDKRYECEYESLLESIQEQETEEFESIIANLEDELNQLEAAEEEEEEEEEEESDDDDEDEDEEDEEEEEDYCNDYYYGIKRRAMKIAEDNWFSKKGKKAEELVSVINDYEEICDLSIGDLPDYNDYNTSGLYNGYVKSALKVWERAFEIQKELLEVLKIERVEDFEEEETGNPLLLEEEYCDCEEGEECEECEERKTYNLYTLENVVEAIEQLTLEGFIINDRPNKLWEEEYNNFYIVKTLFNYFKKNKEINDYVFNFDEELSSANFGAIDVYMSLGFNFKVLKTVKNKEIIKNIENEGFDKSVLLDLDIEYIV